MRGALAAMAALGLASCEREVRDLRLDPPEAAALDEIALSPERIGGAPPDVMVAMDRPYDSNAWQLSQGKRLYDQFNCKGCHADGGGMTGPAFLGGWWRYGSDVVSVFASIRDGRPWGMPSFRGKMTTEQTWQLAGYVRSIGGYDAKTAYPSRNDEMMSRPGESRGPAGADIPAPSR
jgi:cytochrome c oxidase cbb3-type subunit 3